MKTKMIIKFNSFVSYETARQIKKELLCQWNDDGIVLTDPSIEVQAIILEPEKGEIKVINLTDERVKTRKNIFGKIKKLFFH